VGLLSTWLYLATTFTLRHRRKSIAVGGFIAIGCAVLVLIHATAVGVNDTMVRNTTAIHYGDAFLSSEQPFDAAALAARIEQQPAVVAALPRQQLTALIIGSGERSRGVSIYAVDPQREQRYTAIPRRVVEGCYPQAGAAEILLGAESAAALQLSVGDSVTLLAGRGDRLGPFRVTGIFRSHIQHFDSGVGYIPLASISSGAVAPVSSEVALFFASGAKQNLEVINATLDSGLTFVSWRSLRPDLVQLIEMNDLSVALVMLFVFVLVGFGIANTAILTIVERFHELAVLKAMGVTPRELVLLLFLESFILAVIATLIGLAVGWGLSELIAWYGIDFTAMTSSNQYFVMDAVSRPRVTLAGLWQPGALALGVSLLSAWLPARIAGRRMATEGLVSR